MISEIPFIDTLRFKKLRKEAENSVQEVEYLAKAAQVEKTRLEQMREKFRQLEEKIAVLKRFVTFCKLCLETDVKFIFPQHRHEKETGETQVDLSFDAGIQDLMDLRDSLSIRQKYFMEIKAKLNLALTLAMLNHRFLLNETKKLLKIELHPSPRAVVNISPAKLDNEAFQFYFSLRSLGKQEEFLKFVQVFNSRGSKICNKNSKKKEEMQKRALNKNVEKYEIKVASRMAQILFQENFDRKNITTEIGVYVQQYL